MDYKGKKIEIKEENGAYSVFIDGVQQVFMDRPSSAFRSEEGALKAAKAYIDDLESGVDKRD